MNLIQVAGRACFAAFFVVHGAGVRTPTPEATVRVQARIDRALGLARRVVPAAWLEQLPTDAATWLRWLGTAEMGAGVCYGLNIARRPAAGVLALASLPHVAEGALADDPTARRDGLLRGLALLGGSLAAAQAASPRRPAPLARLVYPVRLVRRTIRKDVTH